MKITKVEAIGVSRYLYAKIHTDEGITGLGESGAWGYLEASKSAIELFGRYLVGKDPLRIEHHWQYMYRFSHFRGAAIMGALSALDIAMWDIMGKNFGVPVHQLLGGKTRDKARVYYHVFGDTRERLVQGIKDAKELGFTAVGHLTPFLDESRDVPYFKTHANKIGDAIDTVGAYRDAVGNDVDLCIEIHRRFTPAEAIALGRGIEQYNPYFYEDPILPENFDAMGLVAQHINIPIATGERLHTIHEFEMLLQRGGVQYVRPDVCSSGGLTHCKKIAAIAEAQRIPFDLPEADGDLGAGYHTEYSGMRFSFFMISEYLILVLMSALIVILFFGGWHGAPIPLPGPVWFLLKISFFIWVFMWLRFTFPRYRYDQLMTIGWKVLLPLSLANILITGIFFA